MKKPIAILALLLQLVACERPWIAGRTVVDAAAHGVVAADSAVVAAYDESGCDEAEGEALDECLADLREYVEALRLARASVLEGETIVDVWEHGGEEPAAWRGWVISVGLALARVASLLTAAGVDVPAELTAVAALVEGAAEGVH